MIVLRITIDGMSQQVRSPKTALLLGSDPTADVTIQGAEWPAQVARLHHRGTEVFLEALDGTPSRALRLGETARVGRAEVELVGLLPLAAGEPDMPVFGGYDMDPDTPRTFVLADDVGARGFGTETTSHTFRPQDHRPVLGREGGAPAQPAGAKARQKPGGQAGPARQKTQPKTATKTAERPAPAARQAKPETKAPPPSAAATAAAASVEGQKAARALRGSDDFAAELYATLRKSPFYAVSGAIHFLVFLIIALLDTSDEDSKFDGAPGLIIGDFTAEETIEDTNPDPLDEIPEVDAEFDSPELPPELADLNDPDPDNKPEDPSKDPELSELAKPELKPLDIGVAPRFASFKNRTKAKKPKVTKKELEERVIKGGEKAMNERSAGIVRGSIGLGPGGGSRGLLPRKNQLLVVEGSFDSAEDVLDLLKIQYVKADAGELMRGRKYRLSDFKVIFWNCGEAQPPVLAKRFLPKLKRWVAAGGYLFSTDWGIEQVVAPAWPKLIGTSGQRAPLREMVLHIRAANEARGDPLLEGVFPPNAKGQWWLEQASFDIEVKDKSQVTTLVVAPQLEDVFHRSPAVAVTFEHGKGRVLHVMGHYFQKMGNLAGTISSHRLALNFVVDRIKRDKK
ncbi:MAG: hypothetical protein QNJ98_14240 [Planctomycetota bacterium]|nr:hypothetical protein [Planctomycetota bacterium]